MNAICLITFRPQQIWCDLLNFFNNYKIFVIVDDIGFNLTTFVKYYSNITFIQIANEKCFSNGYIDTNFTLKKLISGWDKALYYFGIEDKNYDFIWFIEDDVFFYNENTIIQIDNQYKSDDLLSKTYNINKDGNEKGWLWDRINIQYSPPYYSNMMCCVRFSKKMMSCINDYASKHKTLFFLEVLFPTIAFKNNLFYSCPSEFNNIFYRHNFTKKDITPNNFYHPVKDLDHHNDFRYRTEIKRISMKKFYFH